MSNDIYTVATVFETKGQAEAEKALRDNEAATKAYEKATQTLNNRMKVSVDQSNKKAKTLGQLDSATKKAENEIKRLAVSVQQGAITGKQYQGRLNQIAASLKKMGLEGAQSKVLSYGRATREATATVKRHEAALKAKAIAQGRTTVATSRLTQATRQGAGASQAIRNQFLGAANAIAVLDGPLGGVASRFSAFGVLAGRAGIALAGLGIATTAFSFVAQRSIRDFAQWETQIRTVENRLNSVGNQIALTSGEIVRLSESIGLSTLADERQVLSAASQLLTFRRVSTDVFEDVLKSAQDLAASGFGTIESETIKLAKALEDPRQSLTSLSRAGVVFSRQQRQVITAMVDSGREAEAMALILDNVEKQVGGAGFAQANNTLAGSFDTIGQGVRTLSRNFGEFVSESLGFRVVVDALAARFGDFVEASNLGLKDTLNLVQSIEAESFKASYDLSSLLNDVVKEFQLSQERAGGPGRFMSDLEAFQQRVVELLKERVEQEEILQNLQSSENILARREEALGNIQTQIDLQRELVGLTQEEERVRRALAAEGLAGDAWRNINKEVEAYRKNLIDAGVDLQFVDIAIKKHRTNLEGVKDIAEEYAQAFRDQSIARELNRIQETTESTNEVMRIQIGILEEARASGNKALTVTEARRRAEIQLQEAMIQTRINTAAAAGAAALMALNFGEAAKQAAIVVEMTALLNNLSNQESMLARIGELGRTGGGGSGGGGGGVDPNAQYQQELEALQSYLEQRREEMMVARGFEREVIFEQYEERHEALRNALDRDLVTRQEYDDLELQLAMSKAEKLAEIERSANSQRLSDMAGFYGALASVAQAGGDRMVKVVAAFSGIQATINAWNAYTAALASPIPMTPWARMTLAAKVLAAGLGAVRNIASAGGGGSGGGGGASGRTANAPREAREATPQRVLIQGIDPAALYSGEQLQNLFDAFQDENKNRGQVFVISQ